jgi:hypothetical protein
MTALATATEAGPLFGKFPGFFFSARKTAPAVTWLIRKSVLTFGEAHELLQELVVGVDNDGEGGDQMEQQQDLHRNLHLQ